MHNIFIAAVLILCIIMVLLSSQAAVYRSWIANTVGSIVGSAEGFVVNKQLTAILHYVDWCGYCKVAKPIFEEIAKEGVRGYRFDMVNEMTNPTPGINSYPRLRVIDTNGKLHEYHGLMRKPDILAWFASLAAM